MRNKTSFVYQNYGTSILIFITGNTAEDAEGQWLSLFNWGATSTEMNFVAPRTVACWSTIDKFLNYFINIHETRLLNDESNKNVRPVAVERAKFDFESITRESFRSVNNDQEPFEMGTITAEKPDEDFADAVLNYAFRNN